MEGKGCLFKKFAGIDVFDIELAERDPDRLVDIVASLEPTLGGINLEDIKAPECFYIERKLTERMGKVEEGAAMRAEARRGLQPIQNEQFAIQQLRLLDAEVAHMLGQSPRARRELEEMLADFQSTSELSLAQWAQEALSRIERDRGTSFIETPEEPESQPASPDEDTVRTRPLR